MLTNFRALTCLHKQANMFNQFIYRLDLLALFCFPFILTLFHECAADKYTGILLPKLFWPTVGKKCSSDRENF